VATRPIHPFQGKNWKISFGDLEERRLVRLRGGVPEYAADSTRGAGAAGEYK
jgi:hypothetical protein